MINERKVKVREKISDCLKMAHILVDVIYIYKNIDYYTSYYISLSTLCSTSSLKRMRKIQRMLSNETLSKEDIDDIDAENAIISMQEATLKITELRKLLESKWIEARSVAKMVDDNDVTAFLAEFTYNGSDDVKIVGNYSRKEFGALTRLLFDSELPRVCELCGSTDKLHIHHSVYELPIERKHLQRLCSRCHIKTHKVLRNLGGLVE